MLLHGDITCFSFHPRKIVRPGDGGMITIPHVDWDAKFRPLCQHAMSVPDTVRHSASQVVFESYPTLGYNYRLTDIQAAIGRQQLARLPSLVAERRVLADTYQALLADVPGLQLPTEPEWARTNWQSYCVRLTDLCDQRTVMQAMLDDEISTRRGIMCSHREDVYRDLPLRQLLPQSKRAQDHCILLPLFPGMSDQDQHRVVSALRQACS